jgi:hypothetical protein
LRLNLWVIEVAKMKKITRENFRVKFELRITVRPLFSLLPSLQLDHPPKMRWGDDPFKNTANNFTSLEVFHLNSAYGPSCPLLKKEVMDNSGSTASFRTCFSLVGPMDYSMA